MGDLNDIELREALYRQFARQPGLPAGLRPELIKRAESCVCRRVYTTPAFIVSRGDGQGCKGAIGR